MERAEGGEFSGSFALVWIAGSDVLVFAESVARRFRVRPRPVEGLLVPRAAGSGAEVLRDRGRREFVLRRSFGVCGAGSRIRGEGGESLKGTQGEQRPRWRGNPRSRERIRRGIKASKGTEFAVRAITVSWTQGNRELGFGRAKGNP